MSEPPSTTDLDQMDGGCNCAEIRYVIASAPLTTYICHCHLCQKRTGSAFSMSVVIPASALQITKGSPQRSERPLSGGGRTISYTCPTCFSRIYTQREGRSTINLRAGTLDDTSELRPVAQFWTSSAQPWAVVQENILSYVEQPDDFTPLVAASQAQLTGGKDRP